MTGTGRRPERSRARHAARRLALAAIFEAEFGQRTSLAILERHLAEIESDPAVAAHARDLVQTCASLRDRLDAEIERLAPQYPLGQLARMDRTLLRLGLCEVLHSPTTPTRVAIAEWVELARIYSGEPARRLVNGVLGRVVRHESTVEHQPESPERGPDNVSGPNRGGSQWRPRTSG